MPEKIDNAIGELLRELREEARISRSRLAEEVDRTDRTIYNYEKGHRRPGMAEIIAIVRVLSRYLNRSPESIMARFTAASPTTPTSPEGAVTVEEFLSKPIPMSDGTEVILTAEERDLIIQQMRLFRKRG